MKNQSITFSGTRQHGMVLEIVLIVLVALLLASVSLFRAVDTSSAISGNIAFKSDANNRAQLAFDQVIAWAASSDNFNEYIVAGTNLATQNYSARMLQTDERGIPLIIKDLEAFTAAYKFAPPTSSFMEADQMKVHYLIERMCTTSGILNKNHCVYTYEGNEDGPRRPGLDDPDKPALRVTVRVDGPHNTVSYIQATVSP